MRCDAIHRDYSVDFNVVTTSTDHRVLRFEPSVLFGLFSLPDPVQAGPAGFLINQLHHLGNEGYCQSFYSMSSSCILHRCRGSSLHRPH